MRDDRVGAGDTVSEHSVVQVTLASDRFFHSFTNVRLFEPLNQIDVLHLMLLGSAYHWAGA